MIAYTEATVFVALIMPQALCDDGERLREIANHCYSRIRGKKPAARQNGGKPRRRLFNDSTTGIFGAVIHTARIVSCNGEEMLWLKMEAGSKLRRPTPESQCSAPSLHGPFFGEPAL